MRMGPLIGMDRATSTDGLNSDTPLPRLGVMVSSATRQRDRRIRPGAGADATTCARLLDVRRQVIQAAAGQGRVAGCGMRLRAAHALEMGPMANDDLRIAFSLRGINGLIAVSVTRNTDPTRSATPCSAAACPPILRGGSRC